MGLYSDILLTADFDRTLTAPDTTIPERNIDAIRYFIENGGAFTVNTGRSLAMFRKFIPLVSVNAPLLLFNGSAAYDLAQGKYTFCHRINLDLAETVRSLTEIAPDMLVEFQGTEGHYLFRENPTWEAFSRANGCPAAVAAPGDDLGPFIKLCVYGQMREASVGHLFQATHEERRRIDQVEADIRARFGDSMTILRVAPRIIDLHAPGVSKGRAARELLAQLGRKTLVCIGDEQNDLTMLDAADYAYCPADAAVADRYENVCPCADGAAADVIYKKIPEILGERP